MPFTSHNEPWILCNIREESERTRDLLRKLRHVVEQGHLHHVPEDLVTKLALHAGLLARAIQQFTIRHDILLTHDGPVHHSTYDGVMDFVGDIAREAPDLMHSHVVHADGRDEYALYRDELGFSEQEYKDLVTWKHAWDTRALDPAGAFEVFSSEVVSKLQSGRYAIAASDLVPGIAGVVGIAADVTFFATVAAVPALVASCTTGIAAIAAKFSEVRIKLLGRGHR